MFALVHIVLEQCDGVSAMNRDELDGKAQAAKARAKQVVGKAAHDEDCEKEGVAEEASGRARAAQGRARRKVGEAIEDIGKAVKRG
jgi:uncharacterized protein YjbJ (UPF0337 family)